MCPIASLVGLEDPSVAVRFSPVLYKLINTTAADANNSTSKSGATTNISKAKTSVPRKQMLENMENSSMIPGKYRMVFAVLTVSAVMVYDTQFPHPIARFGGLHLACINDATWTADGNTLIVCSSDGYVSFIHFETGALGEPISQEEIPETVKRTFASIYLPPEPSAKVLATEQLQAQMQAAMSNSRKSVSSSTAPSVLMTQIINDRKMTSDTECESPAAAAHELSPQSLKRASCSDEDLDMISPVPTEAAFAEGDSATAVLASAALIAPSAEANNIDSANQKKKKRVAPTFVCTLSALGASSNNPPIAIAATALPTVSMLEVSEEALPVATIEISTAAASSDQVGSKNDPQPTEGKVKKRISTTLLSSVPLSSHSPAAAAHPPSAVEIDPIAPTATLTVSE